MQNWCYQYNTYCDNADEHCNCKSTACTKARSIVYENIKDFDECAKYHVKADNADWGNAVKTVRECQVCGNATESMDYFLCDSCRHKLGKLMELIK